MTEKKLKPTVAQAKAAWEAHPKPSLNNVTAALHAAGFTGMVKSTLQRWQKGGWVGQHKPGPRPEPPASAEDVAATKEATQKVTEDETATETKGVADADAERTKLAETALSVLAEMAARESLVAQIMMARQIQNRAEQLIKFTPKDAAKLIEALKKEPASNVTVVMPSKPAENGEMRTVGGNVIEHDGGERPLNQFEIALQHFQQERKLQVVK